MAAYHLFLTICSQSWTIYIHIILDRKHPKNNDIMKESKKEFKYALRACQKTQQKCKADTMAEAIKEQISQKILAEHQKKQEIMASIYSGRRNRK